MTTLWPVLTSRPAEGRRLSWPGWLGEILRWFPLPRRRSSIPVRNAATGNRTRKFATIELRAAEDGFVCRETFAVGATPANENY